MANLIALDWDTHELRAIIARGTSAQITITDAIAIPLADDSSETVSIALRRALDERGLGKSKMKALVAIGRGKAELRQLNLPPVPENELPDMVRFQATQTFAAIGENTVVDFLPLPSTDETTSVLAAAVAPATMKSVEGIIASAGLELARIALRPVAAAALYQIAASTNQNLDDSSIVGDVVLVDLLADDAEIVVLRGRRVMFVRSVRMPQESTDRPAQIAGELRRSLMACGINASSTSQKVVIWGDAKTHDAECKTLAQSLGCRVRTIEPLSLVDIDSKKNPLVAADSDGKLHTGRFAPLIGLLIANARASDAQGSPYLVDFVNPRRPIEIKQDNRKIIIGGVVAASAVLLLAYSAWAKLRSLDADIKTRETQLADLKPQVVIAQTSIDRTEVVDRFLDGNVLWLDELSRTAQQIPPATDAILKSVTAVALQRDGGGKLTLSGAAKSPVVVDELETALRDESHVVSGSGSSDLGDKESYRWGFNEVVVISSDAVRDQRYAALAALRDAETREAETSGAATGEAIPPAQSDDPPLESKPKTDESTTTEGGAV